MKSSQNTNWIELRDRLSGDGETPCELLREVAEQLNAFAAAEGGDGRRARGAQTLSQLAQLAVAVRDGGDGETLSELVPFVARNLCLLDESDGDLQAAAIDAFMLSATERWSEYLVCLESGDAQPNSNSSDWPEIDDLSFEMTDSGADDADGQIERGDDGPMADPGRQIELLLSAIGNAVADHFDGVDETERGDDPGTPELAFTQSRAMPIDADEARALLEDTEMREAFLDDATRCLDMMEKSSLAVEQSPEDHTSVRQFCRELHTLKGASGSVGLAELAAYIHEVETNLEHLQGNPSEQTVEAMLAAVDRVRQVVAEIREAQSEAASVGLESESPTERTAVATPVSISSHSSGNESLIRIRVSKLDRLMDMLAELVVLRNRRESHISEFSEVNDELLRCSSRMSFCQDSHEFPIGSGTDYFGHPQVSGSNTLVEIAKDLSVVSASLRDLQKPVSKDNLAISRFIRDFRQELMQLRRVPIAGLFHRLQRAARDAAHKEGKKIQLVCIGQETGLEQELQEQLHEPLLHIIRNAVSHGIEAPAARLQAGKQEPGTITLEAQSNSQLLAIEIRDNGGGLDYDAIRRRAIDKGLITGNHTLSHQELGRLIFHPGFSTCQQATQVSGRGVGMDIVASVLEQMRGRIEIDSVRGVGTTMRLVVPLRSAIEHVMVFRAAGQLFALPMQSVAGANPSESQAENLARLSLSSMLSLLASPDSSDHSVLVLTGNRRPESTGSDNGKTSRATERIGLAVDEIVGPEEVVVRHIPAPLKSHPLFCGLTLSGAGETVLLLDGRKLVDFCHQFTNVDQRPAESGTKRDSIRKKRVLVVDDSLSARKVLIKKLARLGYSATEAGDGIEALEMLRQATFDLVITDLDMPRLGGLEMLFDIQQRQQSGKNETPVLVVSGRSELEFGQRCMDSGAVGFLPKPINDDCLQRVLSELNLGNHETNKPSNKEPIHE